jgi:sulfate adenylyltransferase subunit 2
MDTAAALRTARDRPLAGPGPGRPAASVTALVRPVEHPLGHLHLLESLAIFIIREVAAESERPVLLFSGGKDSAVLLHLASKAFKPGRLPFPVLHVDTGHNFAEVLAYRDAQVEAEGARLLVAKVQDSIDQGRVADPGPNASRNRLQTTTLLDAINANGFDAAFGGARRDEDKARAKERVLSFRDAFGQWDPKRQRPELWQLYQGTVRPGEHLRAFPLSDWTELDVWQYIRRERIELPSIYYAHEREVVERDGMLLAVSEWVTPESGEEARKETVRFRTVGDATCTGAVRSIADTVDDIIREVSASRISERGATRADDRFSETAMEDRKREGYF